MHNCKNLKNTLKINNLRESISCPKTLCAAISTSALLVHHGLIHYQLVPMIITIRNVVVDLNLAIIRLRDTPLPFRNYVIYEL